MNGAFSREPFAGMGGLESGEFCWCGSFELAPRRKLAVVSLAPFGDTALLLAGTESYTP